MEGPEAGLTTAVTQATELRRHVGVRSITVNWTNEHGDVVLIVDEYGWRLFVNGDEVPRSLAQGRSET